MEDKDLVTVEAEVEEAAKPKNEMRKKILLLVILLLCVGALIALVIFRSGIPLVDFWTVAGSFDAVDTEIAEVKKIEGTFGTRVGRKGALALYKHESADGKNTQTVVHLASGTVVASLSDTDTLRYGVVLHEADGAAWYAVTKAAQGAEETLYSITLYDESGEAFAAKENMSLATLENLKFQPILDLVRFGNEVFRVEKNGTVRSAFTIGAFADLPAFDRKVGNYYFVEQAKNAEEGITEARFVYNEKGVLTATCHVPSAAVKASFFYLSDGTLLLQYATSVGEHTDDYTYAEKNSKYKLHHLLVSARDGAKNELKSLGFYITEILSDEEILKARGLNTGIDNLAWGYHVDNALLDTSDHCLSAVLLSNRGRISSEVGDIIPAMYGGAIRGIAKNRWVAMNLAEECFLLNEWGSAVGSFPRLDSEGLTVAEKLFIYEKGIYDWDLALLYDMKENGIEHYALAGSSVVMYKANGEVLLFDPDEKAPSVLVAAGSDKRVSVLGAALIAVEQTVEGKKQYALYNEHNTHLITLEAEVLSSAYCDINGARTVEILAGTSLYLATAED